MACHSTGVLGAPKLGDTEAWKARWEKGVDVLVKNAVNGFNAMPPKGGNSALSEAEIRSVVDFMLSKVAQADAGSGPVTVEASTPAAAPVAVTAEARPVKAAVPVGATSSPPRKDKRPVSVNAFNRLLKPPSQRNLPPTRDGIHDPANAGTATLQAPRDAFGAMPSANSGNRVDWVAALGGGDIQPRFDLADEGRAPVVLDLNIVREVKGSMPNVVYPHKQHTEWLDCSNCHPAIFIPKKGANNISMASILLGEKCGVCHGKVAFPVSECRKCHSQNKPPTARK